MIKLFGKKKALFLVVLLGSGAWGQSPCDLQLKELRKYALAAKYEQLPEEQKPYFIAQLSQVDRLALMGFQSGHRLGAGVAALIGGGKMDTLTDQFNQKAEEFKRSCGFMLK